MVMVFHLYVAIEQLDDVDLHFFLVYYLVFFYLKGSGLFFLSTILVGSITLKCSRIT